MSNRYAEAFLRHCADDAQSGYPVRGSVEDGTYRFSVRQAVLEYQSPQQGMFLGQLLLLAQGPLERRQTLIGVLGALEPFRGLLYTAVADLVALPEGVPAPPGMVSIFEDLTDPALGLTSQQLKLLSTTLDRAARYLTEHPHVCSVIADALQDALGSGAYRKEGDSVVLSKAVLFEAGFAYRYVPLDRITLSRITTPRVPFEEEVVRILNGERTGVYVAGHYYVFDVKELAEDILLGVEHGWYVPEVIVEKHLSGDPQIAAGVEELVAFKLESKFKARTGVRAITEAKIRGTLREKYPQLVNRKLFVCHRDSIVQCVTTDAVPSRRPGGYSAPERPRKESKDRETFFFTTPSGVKIAYLRGEALLAVESLTVLNLDPETLNTALRGVKRVHSCKDELVSANVWDALRLALQPHVYEEVSARVKDIVVQTQKGMSFREYVRQLEARIARASAEKNVRIQLAFTPEQDWLIAEQWRPFMREPARRRLMQEMPEHAWSRINLRAKLLLDLERKKAPRSMAQDEDALKAMYGVKLKQYVKALGGSKTRVTL